MKPKNVCTHNANKAAPKGVAGRFRLTGRSDQFDPRTTPIRGDLADISLAGYLFAPHYAAPITVHCMVPVSMMRSTPHDNAVAVSQLRHGDVFHFLDQTGDWAWGYSADGYVGYVQRASLERHDGAEPDHWVSARAALIFSEPSIKSAVVMRLPMGARVTATDYEDGFLSTPLGFVSHNHISAFDAIGDDSTALAERLLGAPYLWGGRSGDGLDCSGLVQLVLAMQGINAPRDSDQQELALGDDIPEDAALERNDIVFFPGHVGIMVDDSDIIHANAHWMQVVREPLADVVARLPEGQGITARKRITA